LAGPFLYANELDEVIMTMGLFLDTANLDEVQHLKEWEIIDGLTTNQKIFLNEKGVNFKNHVRELLALVDGPVSIEVTSNDPEGFIAEAKEYAAWGKNVVIKVPMLANGTGLRTIRQLEKAGIKTNATILMTPSQVLLAAKAGASYASLFFRRIQDCGEDPERAVENSRAIIDGASFDTKLIIGSIRSPEDVSRAVMAGAHIVTVPYKILAQMPYHYHTEETAREFDLAWQEFKKAEAQTARLARRDGDGDGARHGMPPERAWTLGGQVQRRDGLDM
jgi:transaldolase